MEFATTVPNHGTNNSYRALARWEIVEIGPDEPYGYVRAFFVEFAMNTIFVRYLAIGLAGSQFSKASPRTRCSSASKVC